MFKVKETEARRYDIRLEFYPGPQWPEDRWFWAIYEDGDLVECSSASDAQVAMDDAHQAIEKTIDY